MGVAYDKGIALFEMGHWSAAAEHLRQSLAEDPDFSPALAMLALSLLNDDQPWPALAAADEAIRLNPTWALPYFVRAQVLPHISVARYGLTYRTFGGTGGDDMIKRIRRARESLDEALRLDPDNANAHAFAAHLENSRYRFKAALVSAQKALALDPTNVAAANERARSFIALGRGHEADRAIGESLSIDPEFAPSHSARGWSLLRVGRAGEAKAAFLEALRLHPNSANSRYGLLQARMAAWALYRWPLQFVLGRTQGIGLELLGFMLPLAIILVLNLRRIHWQTAVVTFIAVTCILVLVLRPLIHLTVRFRR